ncbi:MAG TPA: electron transfer flavoprotein subunit alpha/FixB family protein [Thermodesulfobacteriota bacterium]|nr:electron transfer flavoprotein subunit alpha/FixB family protein [Thermodesulfobacteriota bacterium]
MPSDKPKGNVLVLAEYVGKEIDSITPQLIVKGRDLAQRAGVGLDAVLLGNDLEQQAQKLCKMGVDRVLLMDHASLRLYNPQLYPRVIAGLIKDLMPSVFLLGYTYWGMVIGPAVATRLGVRLFTNCMEVELAEDVVRVTRPLFKGLTYAKVEAKKSIPVVVSLQRGAVSVKTPPEGEGEIVLLPSEVSEGSPEVKALKILAEVEGAEDLKKAEVVVAAGRGIKEKANLKIIEELADALGGRVGCSRPVVDLGWLPLPYQIGISGKTVRPKIYIACGISGALQHVSAITDSEMIIAINNDPKAPIFRVAKHGIVGDLFEVIPPIIKKAKELNVRAGAKLENG